MSLQSLLRPEKKLSLSKDITAKLKAAVREVTNKDDKLRSNVGIGAVFMRLYLPASSSKKDQVIALKRFKKTITERLVWELAEADFIALHIAPYSVVRKVANRYEQDYFDLGLAVLGKIKYFS